MMRLLSAVGNGGARCRSCPSAVGAVCAGCARVCWLRSDVLPSVVSCSAESARTRFDSKLALGDAPRHVSALFGEITRLRMYACTLVLHVHTNGTVKTLERWFGTALINNVHSDILSTNGGSALPPVEAAPSLWGLRVAFSVSSHQLPTVSFVVSTVRLPQLEAVISATHTCAKGLLVFSHAPSFNAPPVHRLCTFASISALSSYIFLNKHTTINVPYLPLALFVKLHYP